MANDAYAIALLRGRTLSNMATQVVRFERGLIVEGWFLDEIPYELDGFYS